MTSTVLRRPRRALAATALAVALALSTAGCSMMKLSRDLGQRATLALVAGVVELPAGAESAPAVVALLREPSPEEPAIVEGAAVLPPENRSFAFAVQARTPYRIVAFVDENGNRAPDVGEPIGDSGPAAIRLEAETRRTDLRIALARGKAISRPWRLAGDADVLTASRLPMTAGEVTTLDDPRFELDQAAAGMWQPVHSALERGLGIYFLEPYDPARIPVLFVHGIGGTPRDFRKVIGALDRDRFQAWVFAYPSGARLRPLADALADLLTGLERAQRFETLVVTAHSMGGLVARAAILELARRGRGDLVDLFVTFATPWNGHAAAASGVRFSPSVVPAWLDMQPTSEFLASVRAPLPASVPFYMLFGYNTGGYNPLMVYSHDSVVSVESQLAPWAQDEARGLWGFDATHEGILELDAPIARWGAILAGELAP